jgi:hypothetical protein
MNSQNRRGTWLKYGALIILGGIVSASLYGAGDPSCGALAAWRLIGKLTDSMGIVMLSLMPLGIWVIKLIIQQVLQKRVTGRMEVDYAYISRSGTILGLIGTIIALGAAGRKLASDMAAGKSNAIMEVVPLTGEALVCTMVGLIIAFAAETALHFLERKEYDDGHASPNQ